MVRIHLADSSRHPLVERLKLGIELRNILEVWSYRLIDEVICNDYRLILIILGDTFPDIAEKLLRGLALKEPRVAVAVIDVVTGLSTRSIVHVKNDIEAMSTAPSDHVIKSLEAVLVGCQAHIILICEELIVERNTDGVRSP